MQKEQPPLTAYSEEQRQAAVVKYKIIALLSYQRKTTPRFGRGT
jgi:putative transposase